MKYSDYTVVSFGDSFCFGQGITKEADLSIHEKRLKKFPTIQERKKARLAYKKECQQFAYTKIIEKNLNFKTSINCGLPGSSNKRTLTLLRNFSKNNKDENIFYLVGLTHATRDLIMTRPERPKKVQWEGYDWVYNSWVTNKDTAWQTKVESQRPDIYNMPPSVFQRMLVYYRNDFTTILEHVMVYDSIIEHLELTGKPYIIFDLINDVPWEIKRMNLVDSLRRTSWADDLLTDVPNLDFEDTSGYITSHYEGLINKTNPKYLNYFAIAEYGKFLNTEVEFVEGRIPANLATYVKLFPGIITRSPITDDNHWNIRGHEVAANLLTDWIRKHYE
jgi:hypothetical protein